MWKGDSPACLRSPRHVGTPGVDGETFTPIEKMGLKEWAFGLEEGTEDVPASGGAADDDPEAGGGRTPAWRRSGIGWCRPPPSWCWNRSWRRTFFAAFSSRNDFSPKYNRDHLRYPSDLTDDEWACAAPLIPPPGQAVASGGPTCERS
jgi:hypothetical protein